MMLGLTLYQPWAWGVSRGLKDIENRPWAPSPSRCPPGTYIAIHAGMTYDQDGSFKMAAILERLGLPPIPASVAQGAVVGVARFDGVVRGAPPPEIAQPAWFFGPVGWVLRDAIAIEPVKCFGSRGLWPLSDVLEQDVRAAWAAALDRDFRVLLRTPAQVEAYRAQAQRSFAEAGIEAPERYTCDDCPEVPRCGAAFDSYNVSGDCLLEK